MVPAKTDTMRAKWMRTGLRERRAAGAGSCTPSLPLEVEEVRKEVVCGILQALVVECGGFGLSKFELGVHFLPLLACL